MAVLLLQIIKIDVLREGIFTKFRYYETKLSETFRLQLLLSSCQFIDTDAIFFYFLEVFPETRCSLWRICNQTLRQNTETK